MQISSFSIYVADVLKHIDELSESNAGLSIFLLGHSMVSSVKYCCRHHCHNIVIVIIILINHVKIIINTV